MRIGSSSSARDHGETLAGTTEQEGELADGPEERPSEQRRCSAATVGVAEAVLGHQCGGVVPHHSGIIVACSREEGEEEKREGQGDDDGMGIENGKCASSCPSDSFMRELSTSGSVLGRPKACSWASKLGPDRRRILQAYCVCGSGGGTGGGGGGGGDAGGVGNSDIAAWLGEGEVGVMEAVSRLLADLRSS